MRPLLVLTAAAIASVSLASCSGPNTSSAPATITTVVTVADAPVSTPPSPASGDTGTAAAETNPERSVVDATGVGAVCNRVLANGDELKVGEATSCEFALAMYEAAFSATYYMHSSDPTANALPRTSFELRSPVTGETYPINCYSGSDGKGLRCYDSSEADPNHATVSIWVRNWEDGVTSRMNVAG